MSGIDFAFHGSVTPPDPSSRGFLLVLSSPSGAGKTSISRAIIERHPDIALSTSWTTRPPRDCEIEGVHYHFVSREKFEAMVRDKGFIEHAVVHDNYYGTPRAPVVAALEAGRDLLFDVDWQGAMQMAANAKADLVSVFILPPSFRELASRLRNRAQDSDAVIRARLINAIDEMTHYDEYDYAIVNRDLKASIDAIEAILALERLKRHRQVGLPAFVERLREDGLGELKLPAPGS